MNHGKPASVVPRLARFAWLSLAAAVATVGLKLVAYLLTGSVGLLSDALESLVNLAAALLALGTLIFAAQPPDEEHPYGHTKAEYFASGAEGFLILAAALSIGYAAFQRILHPQPISNVELGLLVSVAAALVNWVVARVLLCAGRRYRAIVLEANARHLLADVWTTVGVVLGVAVAGLTGLYILDPLLGLLVAANIVRWGIVLVRRSALGLLDTALPPEEQQIIRQVLDRYQEQGVRYHALRTRQAGTRRFMSVHVLVPGSWTVAQGHHLLEEVEAELQKALPGISVFTHLEPLEDPRSWQDIHLDRSPSAPPTRVKDSAGR
ncbi:MAG: cation-efflux pump [Chloroflexota bacterium]